MTRATEKTAERRILNEYLKLRGTAPNAITEGETPDFVVTIGTDRIGVEVTEYLRMIAATPLRRPR